MGNEHRARSRVVLIVQKCSTGLGPDSRRFEETIRHEPDGHRLRRPVASRQIVAEGLGQTHRREARGSPLPFREVARSHLERLVPGGRLDLPQGHDAVRIHILERPKQDVIGRAEYRRVRPDPDRERYDGDDRESRTPPQLPPRHPHVLPRITHHFPPVPSTSNPKVGRDTVRSCAIHVAESAPCLGLRLLG